MAIDFDKEQGRKEYLTSKLDDLLDGINDSYGKVLLDELISRLEGTVKDFNDEIQSLTNQLKENTSLKQELLEKIITEETAPPSEGPSDDALEDETDSNAEEGPKEMSEWERRLEDLSKKE
ncbi:MAG: hypothetical protein HOD97_04330 [Candidatus Marinimicrobia bacterium]|jgi:uncharacterized protein Yka (UPF0111/DUF47 family)|nr:hypothetical protein [Candidatus Neomarinimicrobiota bacterium]MBT3618200.1 hypothetical protein [Candidatus Neomarinimicrobiota bacterium]MBT3828671.1 hypothetical protein [Candidatus Neomarinimicrobiota bacterium]MBT3996867.1 hypothetical protein [Candidatus Neomarinimicrobiota bacterium]MBT4280831.1 hypothetical protein [Candidatus Neomarinimicrobiota bacterium]